MDAVVREGNYNAIRTEIQEIKRFFRAVKLHAVSEVE